MNATAASAPYLVATMIGTSGTATITGMLALVPGVSWALVAYGAWMIVNSAESLASSLCEAVVTGQGMELSIGFRWFSSYIKSRFC